MKKALELIYDTIYEPVKSRSICAEINKQWLELTSCSSILAQTVPSLNK